MLFAIKLIVSFVILRYFILYNVVWNDAVEWLAHLLCNIEVSASYVGPKYIIFCVSLRIYIIISYVLFGFKLTQRY